MGEFAIGPLKLALLPAILLTALAACSPSPNGAAATPVPTSSPPAGLATATAATELPAGTLSPTPAGTAAQSLGGLPASPTPIPVAVGLKILRISQVDSQDENFTILGSLRMDWTDPALAFDPETCNCSLKLYTEKQFDDFLAHVQSLWPDFTFFNQLGNRWIKSRAAAIWPDGRVRYAESFSATFQADFDFRQYPFDTETFPIYLDMLYPSNVYTLVPLPGYSEIDPQHGEDEFVITDFTATPGLAPPNAADSPASRITWSFDAPRHLNYYVLQIFVPILLIILISWFTFFLRDYTRRIEAAAANILLFIAFNFSLASNYPRLGYVTFLDAIMSVTFVVNVLVLLYNVMMRRLETQGQIQRVERIDNVLDWVYPLFYIGLIGLVIVWFF
jgi:hypothetical protein